jgi:uncharacterized membrane protein
VTPVEYQPLFSFFLFFLKKKKKKKKKKEIGEHRFQYSHWPATKETLKETRRYVHTWNVCMVVLIAFWYLPERNRSFTLHFMEITLVSRWF